MDHPKEHLEYAQAQLREAVACLSGQSSRVDALQKAWTENVQHLWEKRYLPEELNDRFKKMWRSYTQRTDDPRTTQLRDLSTEELSAAIRELESLAHDTLCWTEAK